jgi:hypothetical protein
MRIFIGTAILLTSASSGGSAIAAPHQQAATFRPGVLQLSGAEMDGITAGGRATSGSPAASAPKGVAPPQTPATPPGIPVPYPNTSRRR